MAARAVVGSVRAPATAAGRLIEGGAARGRSRMARLSWSIWLLRLPSHRRSRRRHHPPKTSCSDKPRCGGRPERTPLRPPALTELRLARLTAAVSPPLEPVAAPARPEPASGPAAAHTRAQPRRPGQSSSTARSPRSRFKTTSCCCWTVSCCFAIDSNAGSDMTVCADASCGARAIPAAKMIFRIITFLLLFITADCGPASPKRGLREWRMPPRPPSADALVHKRVGSGRGKWRRTSTIRTPCVRTFICRVRTRPETPSSDAADSALRVSCRVHSPSPAPSRAVVPSLRRHLLRLARRSASCLPGSPRSSPPTPTGRRPGTIGFRKSSSTAIACSSGSTTARLDW